MARKQLTNEFPTLSRQGVTVEDICRTVAADFKRQGLSQQQAADKLGLERRAVANQISGKRPFARKTAKLYALAFGYNEDFLVNGNGKLFDEGPEGLSPQTVTITLKKYTDLIRENAELKALVQNTLGVTTLSEPSLSSAHKKSPWKRRQSPFRYKTRSRCQQEVEEVED